MATLTGQQVKTTYDSLLKLKDNDSLTSGKKIVTDGLGNDTPLSLSNVDVESSVNIEAPGFQTPTGVSSEYLMADGSVSSGDVSYTHNQGSAASVWNIAHNTGKFCSVTVVDSGNTVVVGEIVYTDSNNIVLTFNASFSGKAYIN